MRAGMSDGLYVRPRGGGMMIMYTVFLWCEFL